MSVWQSVQSCGSSTVGPARPPNHSCPKPHACGSWCVAVRCEAVRCGAVRCVGSTVCGCTVWGSTVCGCMVWDSTVCGSTVCGSTVWGSTVWGSAVPVSGSSKPLMASAELAMLSPHCIPAPPPKQVNATSPMPRVPSYLSLLRPPTSRPVPIANPTSTPPPSSTPPLKAGGSI